MSEEKIVKHQYGAYTLLFMALAVGWEKLMGVIGYPDPLISPIISTLLSGGFFYFLVKWIYDLVKRRGRVQTPAEKISRKKDLKIVGIILGIITLLIIVACIIAVI